MREWAPFVLQGLVMGVDEFYCHRRRRLRHWERLGHPLDTLLFVLCLLWLRGAAPSHLNAAIFGAAAVFNCLFITKDEWQHQELCSGFENWLHALLFLLHPVVLAWAGLLWWEQRPVFARIDAVVMTVASAFMFYQIWFWRAWRHD